MVFSILPFWGRLQTVRSMKLIARSKSASGWDGEGQGSVDASLEEDSLLVFQERGLMHTARGEHRFQNALRWRLDSSANCLILEHLHRASPVYLFSLAPVSPIRLVSREPYQCGKDAYSAQVDWDALSIGLFWAVEGATKNESIEYYYF